MGLIQSSFQPDKVAAGVYIATGAIIVGDVTIGATASVWFNAVLRGDSERLIIGAGANIQDGAICHADPGLPLIIGEGVTVGHRAIVHGARIGDHTLIGMGAIVMNGARVGANCIVGAGSLITQRKIFPRQHLDIWQPGAGSPPRYSG